MNIKDEYYEKLEAQLKDWGKQIDELKAKAAQASAEMKEKYDETLQVLIAKRDEVASRLLELRKSGDEAWVDIKVGLENALDEMRGAFDNAVSKFK